ncbi:hypothetical protein F4804DRAFT_350518 [Jackrogersella minutella]|nr:hypothetical protein F4804DRAFT_350518 [Jackrogersella minutella]
MCFIEYLGYTCGHTSLPIKRPCPMTTSLHDNPCCPQPAARPILAATMCPSCARILHARWVNIIVHEHRFMHERGACRCEVRFPHLQEPRLVSHQEPGGGASVADSAASTAVPGTPEAAKAPFHFSPSAAAFTPSASAGAQPAGFPSIAAVVASAGSAGAGTSKGKNGEASFSKGKNVATIPDKGKNAATVEDDKSDNGNTAGIAPAMPPLFAEKAGGNGTVAVDVRMPSQYGAEWVADHAARHRDGQCRCEISFGRYPAAYQDMLDEARESEYDADVEDGAQQDAAAAAGVPMMSSAEPPAGAYAWMAYMVPAYAAAPGGYAAPPPHPPAAAPGPSGGAMRWTYNPYDAWVQSSGAPAGSVAQSARPVDMQTVSYNMTETPIAALPIGAGPEGDSHMPPFDECELYYPQLHHEPGDPRSASH